MPVSKQVVLMVVLTLAGTVGVYAVSPFWGVSVYYLFAVLRPQYMWKWSLPEDVPWSYYVALATMGGVLLGLHRKDREADPGNAASFRLTAAHVWLGLFAVWVLLTAFTAQSFDASYPWMVEYLKIFIMFGVSVVVIRSPRQVWALFLIVALSLGYIAYEINYLYLINNYLGIYHNGYGGLDNNGAGLMLAMGVPLSWFAFEGLRGKVRWFFGVLSLGLIHAVLMTYSRGAMLSMIVVTPLMVLRSGYRAKLGLGLVVLGLVGIPAMAGKEIRARFMTIEQHETDASANGRKAAWGAAWKMAKDYPLLGVGLRNANLLSRLYGADIEGRTIHSQYLQIVADNGFPGLGLYLVLLFTTWRNTARVRQAMRDRTDCASHTIRSAAGGLECSLAVFAFGSIFLSLEVFELPYLIILLSAQLAGLSVRRGEPPGPPEAPHEKWEERREVWAGLKGEMVG
jgi:probable O-glycosylation ligase (exosortase A-associated)